MKLSTKTPVILALFAAAAFAGVREIRAEGDAVTDFRTPFLKLCDISRASLAEDIVGVTPGRHRSHYIDSYEVRALAAAYDLTGDVRDLQSCQAWSDRMIRYQDTMSPAGAYYMNYERKPGETKAQWYVADSASIAMAVLATAVRTQDPALHAKYLDSVKRFADLVLGNYVRDGGISDGIWKASDGPWWCSTGTFGSLAFLLYDECGDRRYLDAGFHAIDWLNGQDLATTAPFDLKMQGSSLIMYFFEAYSAGLHDVPAGTPRWEAMLAKMREGIRWFDQHHAGDPGGKGGGYNTQWGSKAAGLPFHLYIWSRFLPLGSPVAAKADAELSYVCSTEFDPVRFKTDPEKLSQQMAFSMMSLAEKLGPDLIYRR